MTGDYSCECVGSPWFWGVSAMDLGLVRGVTGATAFVRELAEAWRTHVEAEYEFGGLHPAMVCNHLEVLIYVSGAKATHCGNF